MKYLSGLSLTNRLASRMAPSVPYLPSLNMTFPPKASIICLLSTDTLSLITISTGYPFMAPIMAKATPVLPDVGSMMVFPSVSVPSSSACWTILRAILSLMLPVGLNPSTLA